MWDFFNRRRRSRRRTQTSMSEGQTWSVAADGHTVTNPLTTPLARSGSQPFFNPSQLISESPPKCISRLPCSQILYGERLEDFSTDCWLENHLHRFGFPSSNGLQTHQTEVRITDPFDEEGDDSTTGSSESEVDTIGYSDIDMDIFNLEDNFTPPRTNLALQDLFNPPGWENPVIASPDYSSDFLDPPPYSQFPEEPPPTYEEAVAQQERRSNGTRSSSSSLAIMW